MHTNNVFQPKVQSLSSVQTGHQLEALQTAHGTLAGLQAWQRLTYHLHTSIPEQLHIDMVETGHFLGLQAAVGHSTRHSDRARNRAGMQ